MTITELQRPGVYRRHIRLNSKDGEVRADMEDDSHRFGVILKHDSKVVQSIEGLPLRTPWSLCPGAAELLKRLVGASLTDNPLGISRHTDAKQQCTHMFDLAGLAIAHATRPAGMREYRIEAPWYELNSQRNMILRRDGEVVACWTLIGSQLIEPEFLAGVGVRKLLDWAGQNVNDTDDLEALFIMRRAVLISGSRIMDLDRIPNPEATGHGIGACFVHQPVRIAIAQRNLGSTLDFTDRQEALLVDIPSP